MLARCLALCSLALCTLSAADPGLNQIRSVYLLPMTGGLDQYLANRLVQENRFQVVTDPALAEAIFTDRLGADFEQKMLELYPPPKPEKPEAEKKEDPKDASMAELIEESAGGSGSRLSSFSRGKGNIFLVDRESRRVLWSHFGRSKSTAPQALDQLAGDITDRLHSDMKKLAKTAAKTAPVAPPPAAATPPAAVAPAAPAAAEPVKPVPPVPPAKN